jgi:hypothetical protein
MLKKFYWTYLLSGAYLVGTTFAGIALKKQKGKEPNKFIEENTVN